MNEINPLVTEKYDFEHRDKSIVKTLFKIASIGILTQRTDWMDI